MHHCVRFEDFSILVLRDGAETQGQFCLCEVVVRPRTVLCWRHQHLTFDQIVVGVEGITRWTVGSEQVVIGPGERLYLPRGVTHGFLNRQSYAARFLCTYTPAVITPEFFDALHEAAELEPIEERLSQIQASCGRYGTMLVQPQRRERCDG